MNCYAKFGEVLRVVAIAGGFFCGIAAPLSVSAESPNPTIAELRRIELRALGDCAEMFDSIRTLSLKSSTSMLRQSRVSEEDVACTFKVTIRVPRGAVPLRQPAFVRKARFSRIETRDGVEPSRPTEYADVVLRGRATLTGTAVFLIPAQTQNTISVRTLVAKRGREIRECEILE